MISILSNVGSLRLQNIMNYAVAMMTQSAERMVTGKRINSAKDDAAGYMLSVRMDSQIRGAEFAKQTSAYAKTVTDGVADSVGMVYDKYTQIKELAQKAANTSSTEDRDAYEAEAKILLNDVRRIEAATKEAYNLKPGTTTFQIGSDSSSTSRIDVDLSGWINPTSATLTIDFSDSGKINDVINDSETLAKTCGGYLGTLGATSNTLESNIKLQDSMIINLSEAKSRITDADMARESSNFAKSQISAQTALALMTQFQNFSANMALSLIKGM